MSNARTTPEVSSLPNLVQTARLHRATYLGHLVALAAAGLAGALGRLGTRLERAYEAELDRCARGTDPYGRLPIPRI